jgi:hypothetical protein
MFGITHTGTNSILVSGAASGSYNGTYAWSNSVNRYYKVPPYSGGPYYFRYSNGWQFVYISARYTNGSTCVTNQYYPNVGDWLGTVSFNSPYTNTANEVADAAFKALRANTNTLDSIMKAGNTTTVNMIMDQYPAGGRIYAAQDNSGIGISGGSDMYSGAQITLLGKDALNTYGTLGSLYLASASNVNAQVFIKAGYSNSLIIGSGVGNWCGITLSNFNFSDGISGSSLTGITASQVGAVGTNKTISINGVTNNLNDNPSFTIASGTNFPYTVITNSPWATTNQLGITAITDILLSGSLLYDAEGSNLHFEVECSTNQDFSNAVKFQTTNSVSGWYYFNGSIMAPLTTNGLVAAYQDTNGLAFVQFTTNIAFNGAYVRARSWDGVDYSNYRVGYGKQVVSVASGGTATGASVTGEGATYLPSSTGVVVNASEYKKYIMSLSTNIVMQAPTNAVAGRSLQWSITAVGTNRWVTWPTNSFKIPTSSTMSNSVEIVKDTESIFVIEYRTNAPNWKLESYIFGY